MHSKWNPSKDTLYITDDKQLKLNLEHEQKKQTQVLIYGHKCFYISLLKGQ